MGSVFFVGHTIKSTKGWVITDKGIPTEFTHFELVCSFIIYRTRSNVVANVFFLCYSVKRLSFQISILPILLFFSELM